MRHVTLDSTAEAAGREQFVRERLLGPAAWIHHAKAVRAGEEGQHHHHAWHLLRARQWNASHSVTLAEVAALAIINGG